MQQVSLDDTPLKCICLRRDRAFDIAMTLNFDTWPWEPIQQCPLAWWIFVPSFIEIFPLSTEISCHAKQRR